MRWALACLLLAAAAPSGASAQDADALDQRARIHFQSGTAHYDAGSYEAALREFEAAYELSERVGLLYNIYLTQERLGNLEEAADNLGRYLESDEVPAERRQVLELRLDNLRRRLESRGDDGAGTPPPPPDTGRGEPDVVEPPADDAVAPPPATGAEEDEESGGVSVPAIVAFAVAGVGAVTWATFGILAMNEDAYLEDECPCTEDELSDLETFNTLGDIGFGVTIAGAVAGTLLLALSGGDEEEDAAAMALSPWMYGDGGGLAARGAF